MSMFWVRTLDVAMDNELQLGQDLISENQLLFQLVQDYHSLRLLANRQLQEPTAGRLQEIAELEESLFTTIESFKRLHLSAEEMARIEAFNQRLLTYLTEWHGLNKELTVEKMAHLEAISTKAMAEINRLLEQSFADGEALVLKNLRHYSLVRNLLFITIGAILPLFACLAFFLLRLGDKHERSLYEQAHHDGLTSLPNRQLFAKQFASIVKKQGANIQGAMIFLDLDNFKRVNDMLGHATGDSALVAAADRIRKGIRHRDLVMRLGGDEFVIFLLDETEAQAIEDIVRRILDSLNFQVGNQGESVLISATAGVALYPQNGMELNALIQKADTALLLAKSQGKNCFAFWRE